MNKEEVLQLNVTPDGKEAWLSYDQYQELQDMFDQVEIPLGDSSQLDSQYSLLFYPTICRILFATLSCFVLIVPNGFLQENIKALILCLVVEPLEKLLILVQ